MPVGMMLSNMSQEELCYWIVYHRLENAKFDEDMARKTKTKDTRPKERLTKNDEDMMAQLLALAGKKR